MRHLRKLSLCLIVLLIVGWTVYLEFGYRLIDLAYHAADSAFVDSVMPGREATPVQSYYRAADRIALRTTILALASFAAIALLLHNFFGAVLLAFSCLASTFALFLLFETFPSLIPLAHLDAVFSYYAYKVNYLPDADLGYREKPFNRRIIRDFNGTGFSSIYRVAVQPYTIEWIMDRDGFRNPQQDDFADMIVLGDSYVEYGATADDTWVGRLERKLAPLQVRNLGKSGYTIPQYVRTLKRFGLRHRPRLAVLTIYEGNDAAEMRDFLLWRSGRTEEISGALLKFTTDSVIGRYRAAAGAMTGEVKKRAHALQQLLLDKLALRRDPRLPIHPEVAVVSLAGRAHRKLFIDKVPETPPAQLLSSEEFRAIGNLLREFEEICRSQGIAPLIVYIPTAAHIYAQYSTPESGSEWLRVRRRQVAARENLERAFRIVAGDAGVPFVSLSPVFESAAASGQMLYYPLDAHWNAEGREVAAEYLAALISERFRIGASHPAQGRRMG